MPVTVAPALGRVAPVILEEVPTPRAIRDLRLRIADVLAGVELATDPDGPGGAELTTEESREVIRELAELAEACGALELSLRGSL